MTISEEKYLKAFRKTDIQKEIELRYIKELARDLSITDFNKEIIKTLNKDVKNYKLSSNKKGFLEYYDNDNKEYYQINPNDFTKVEYMVYTILLNEENNNNELEYYTYGFECPNIDNLKTKEQKDIIYNKILNQFQEELKSWIYK